MYAPLGRVHLVVIFILGLGSVIQKTNAKNEIVKFIEDGTANALQLTTSTGLKIVTPACSLVKSLLGVSYNELGNDNITDVNNLTLVLSTKSGNYTYSISNASTTLPTSPGYNFEDKLMVYVHGFRDSPTSSNYELVRNTVLNVGGYNLVALDASNAIDKYYLRSTSYTLFIGQKLGELLAALVNHGVDPNGIMVVGHSLGAHIAGNTGRAFFNTTGQKLKRVTGLDPAGPCYMDVDENYRLSSGDAAYVDVIMTNAGLAGIDQDLGHANYRVNGGSVQEHCVSPSCNHRASILYWVESFLRPMAFPARTCTNWDTFKRRKCRKSRISFMGVSSSPISRGTFYLQTNRVQPYGKGYSGLSYED